MIRLIEKPQLPMITDWQQFATEKAKSILGFESSPLGQNAICLPLAPPPLYFMIVVCLWSLATLTMQTCKFSSKAFIQNCSKLFNLFPFTTLSLAIVIPNLITMLCILEVRQSQNQHNEEVCNSLLFVKRLRISSHFNDNFQSRPVCWKPS